jgi:hypothetical protein
MIPPDVRAELAKFQELFKQENSGRVLGPRLGKK